MRLYSRLHLLFLSLPANGAALILTTWIAANPPEAVMQSRPGIDIQVGHNRLIGLVGRNSGISLFDFGIAAGLHFRACRAVQHETVTARFRCHTASPASKESDGARL